ncbi:DarT ssDNA thymidine ADP-ribosyltransferase family protein [Pantoea sp. CTOTU50773]|uniref:DarT ssDNA thymidine ADP-ribosyltransferase family protein n=1 Tax=Pantoea sp. CTOTU50773 TaxID=2953853 RepID=UPI0028B049B0|nr:DarT ssDNA thymidine ADP-ribosyltransferase family protein [Pantoea sp. CTOTU50773]
MTLRNQRIQQLVAQREITQLIHFTRVENLASIINHGIIPVDSAIAAKLAPAVNDLDRLDGYRNASCISISLTNHRMFWKYRQENPTVDWVVLGIRPSVLWEKNCAFCRHNAADGRITSQQLQQLTTVESLIGMFDEIDGVTPRSEQRLLPHDTTDSQAEVLVFDTIEPEYIFAAAFNKQTTFDSYGGLLGDRKKKLVGSQAGVFATRSYLR